MARKIDTKFARQLVKANWEIKNEAYLATIEATGTVDSVVHDVIMMVPGNYSWFNHLTDGQRFELVSVVTDTVSELV